jgi:retron-type reverse transcriptase
MRNGSGWKIVLPSLPYDHTRPRTRRWAAQNLAARLLARPWTLAAIDGGIGDTLGKLHPRTRAALTVRVFALGEDRYPPAPRDLVAFLLRSRFFDPQPGRAVAAVLDAPVFAPLPRFAGLAIPALATPGELAMWLGLSAGELDWFSDARDGQNHARSPLLLHYHHAVARKRAGAVRLLEAPKARLKTIQRRILREILAPVPVHECAHGFVAGRSCLTGARIHAGEAVVVSFDLAAFFPSIGAPRVHGIFRSLGYPWAVARHLTRLCTAVTPMRVIELLGATPGGRGALREVYGARHLPQGAPTSPALANLLAWRLDVRLHGLARAAGANYSRYADDLAFSGDADFARSLGRFRAAVARIVEEEGFRLNEEKTRIMPRQARQSVTGVVVNAHCNVGRRGFDALKAVLHNCVHQGVHSQNLEGVADFRRHLEGRIAWVTQVNPHRGAKLWRVFERIEWGEVAG